MSEQTNETGFPSVDKPWLKYYEEGASETSLPACTIYEYIRESNRDYADGIAMHYFGKDIIFGELFREIDRTAAAFVRAGIRAGDIVTMVTVTTPETVYALYALNRLGAVSNMVDPRTSVEGIREYICEVKGSVVLAIDAAANKVREACTGTDARLLILVSPADSMPAWKGMAYRLTERFKGQPAAANREEAAGFRSTDWRTFIAQGEGTAWEPAPYEKDRCCVIVHTGGTTGVPKGVMLSDDALNAAVFQGDKSGLNFIRGCTALGVMPPFIAYGIINSLHYSFWKGAKLVIIPVLDPKKYDRLIIKYRPYVIAGVPSHFGNIIESKRMKNVDLSYLPYPCVGGDSMTKKFEEELNAFLRAHNCPTNIVKGYGMTEICAAICQTAEMRFNKVGSVGTPLSHSVVSIFDPDTGEELPYGTSGEVCMYGPHMMLGYFNNEAETNKVFRRHADGNVWLHSGDMGYMDEDGCLFIQGRIKSMIIRGDGFKVYPHMVEHAVASCEEVEQCAVVGAADKTFSQGQRPVAFVVRSASSHGTDEEIIERIMQHCAGELPEYALPMAYRVIESLPLTNIGKVDYRALEQQLKE